MVLTFKAPEVPSRAWFNAPFVITSGRGKMADVFGERQIGYVRFADRVVGRPLTRGGWRKVADYPKC